MATIGFSSCCLSIDDFNQVVIACWRVSPHWEELAPYLGIDRPTVEGIQKERGGQTTTWCLNKLIRSWLLQLSPTQPKPSWRILCDAVSNIDRPLSEKIWTDHTSGCSLCRGVRFRPFATAVWQVDVATAAKKLSDLFDDLLDFLTTEIRRIVVSKLRLCINKFFRHEEELNDETGRHLLKIEDCPTSDAVLNYFVLHNFIGYINYSLIKVFQGVAKSPLLDKRIEEYEKDYQCFLELSLSQIHDGFQQCPDLHSDYPAGIPNYTIHLKSEWNGKSMFSLKEFLKQCFYNRDCIDQLMIAKISRGGGGDGGIIKNVSKKQIHVSDTLNLDTDHSASLIASQDYAPYLKKAAEKGTILTRYSSLGLFGAAGTGKTSTLRLITDQPPIHIHESTPVLKPEEFYSNNDGKVKSFKPSEDKGEGADEPWNSDEESSSTESTPAVKQQTVVAPTKHELFLSDWKPVTMEVLRQRLANCVKTASEEEKMANLGKQYSNNSSLLEGFQMSKNDKDKLHSDTGSTILTSKASPVPRPQDQMQLSFNETDIEILETIAELNKTPKSFGLTHFISTCDTGGQAAFLDIAPAFLRFNSFNIILLKLNENLDDNAQFFYSENGVRVGNETRRISTRDLVCSFISSAKSRRIHEPDVKGRKVVQPQKPKFMILGTHFDKYKEKIRLASDFQNKDEKNEKLKQDLSAFADCLIRNSDTKIMFSLNTLARDKVTENMASKIRKWAMVNYMEAEIPVSWYLFQLKMFKIKSSKKHQGIIPLATLIDIAGSVTKMPEDEVKAALQYFHDLHLCLYFPKVVSKVVFTNPQFLFDKISKIIAFSFGIGTGVIDREFENLTKHGKFTETLLNRHVFKAGFEDEDIFSTKDFLALMDHFFVVCFLPDTDEYFMPCVLTTHPNPCEDFSKYVAVKPLALTWLDKSLSRNGFVPNGLFPSLTTKIQACNGINNISLTMSEVEQQYRNKITLHSDNLGCRVTLIECTSFIAVYAYVGVLSECTLSPADPEDYVKVRRVMLRCIDEIVIRFDWLHAKPEECFLCDMRSPKCPVNLHLCYSNEFRTKLSCDKTENTVASLTVSQLAWWKELVPDLYAAAVQNDSYASKNFNDQLPSAAPTVEDLQVQLHNLTAWELFTTHLPGIDQYDVAKIFKDYHGVDRQKLELYKIWLNKCTCASWDHVINALEKNNHNRLAADIKQWLKTNLLREEKSKTNKSVMPKETTTTEWSTDNGHVPEANTLEATDKTASQLLATPTTSNAKMPTDTLKTTPTKITSNNSEPVTHNKMKSAYPPILQNLPQMNPFSIVISIGVVLVAVLVAIIAGLLLKLNYG